VTAMGQYGEKPRSHRARLAHGRQGPRSGCAALAETDQASAASGLTSARRGSSRNAPALAWANRLSSARLTELIKLE